MIEYEMKIAVEKKTKECVEIIEKHFNVKMITPKISLKLRGTCAGKAYGKENLIKINAVLLNENYDDMLNQTVPHEIAHIATRVIHRRRCKPHGYEWREVMLALGLSPDRCHSYDVSNSQVRKVKRKKYAIDCDCQTHYVSQTIIRRMRQGSTYTCNKCKTPLRTS